MEPIQKNDVVQLSPFDEECGPFGGLYGEVIEVIKSSWFKVEIRIGGLNGGRPSYVAVILPGDVVERVGKAHWTRQEST